MLSVWMTLRIITSAIVLGGALFSATGCGLTGSSTAGDGQFGAPILVQRGRVIAVRDVWINGSTPSGNGAQGVGVVVNGQKAQLSAQRVAQEITVELETGKTVIVVQEPGKVPFAPDERVLVQMGGTAEPRVIRTQQMAG